MVNRKQREIEAIVLAMFAALPLYVTHAVSPVSVLMFHLTMGVLGLRVAIRGTDFTPLRLVVQVAGAAYLIFFPFDAMVMSRSLIRASGHLIFFIIIYQSIESSWRSNQRQRFLTTFLLFITSVATATHMTIVLYIAGFAFLSFRHLIHLSHERTSELLGVEPRLVRPSRAALLYVLPTTLVAGMFFPMLPRVRNPFVSGLSGNLAQASTGISDSIDFNEARSISPDGDVVSRVWMSRDALTLLTPLRLRVRTYERYDGREWRSARRPRLRWLDISRGQFLTARAEGFSREVKIQQRASQPYRSAYSMLYLPVGTFAVRGFDSLQGNRASQVFMAHADSGGIIDFSVLVSAQSRPMEQELPLPVQYPIEPEVARFTRRVIGNAQTPIQAAAKIETYLSTRFTYLANPAELGRPISVEEFLLRERRGHCEYFAAGMVVMLTSLDVPARIVGGYYGGDVNPLTGYFVVRKRDAHAWVELWDRGTWRTYDPTPPAQRPGTASSGLIRAYMTAVNDSINYFWDRYILTYGLGDQVALVQETLARTRRATGRAKSNVSTAVNWVLDPMVIGLIGGMAVIVLLVLRFRRRTIFDQLSARLAGLGVSVTPSMAAYEVLEAVRQQRPDLESAAGQVMDIYLRERFSPTLVRAEARANALRALNAMR